ncbi:MAG: THAP domain-containing protein [Gammaproteobacteria bacterium]|nr:THAP domain-containing protein [Gammaproteobacteria bacterium]
MGFKCAANNCRSGYKSSNKKISMFRFPPRESKYFDEWMCRLRRVDYEWSPSSRLCAEHFVESDFDWEKCDSNKWRKPQVCTYNVKLLK